MVPNAVENHIVSLPTLGKVLPGVINDMIRADGLDHLDISGTAYSSHLGAERLGELYGE
jgi:hypothetical protein